MYRSVYEPVRDAYNSILPVNATPAPPLDEWVGVNCICKHVICRYSPENKSYCNQLLTRASEESSVTK